MKKKSKLVAVICILLVFVIVSATLIYHGEWDLKVTKYTIDNKKISTQFRVALLSDLHLREYGEKNCELLTAVKEQYPDIIVVAGDMVDKKTDDISVAVDLFKELCKITDVYFCLGNHERAVDNRTGMVFSELQKTGAIYLDNDDITVNVKNQDVIIGGLSSYPDYYTPHYEFISEYEKSDLFKLLLCHYPEYYPGTLEKGDFDLILSGHAHGGQVRLPLIGGLFAPEQGLFPEYTKGIYKSETATMILTAGLGDSNVFPRINNPPELVIIDIK